jgi:diguanylate cyclase (GGDEF)-like protein
VLDVNRKTLELFGAASQAELLSNLGKVFRDEMGVHFAGELLDMWSGVLSYEREGINYSLSGEPIAIHLQWTVLPGFESTLGRVLVSIADRRERKRAEYALLESEVHFHGLFENAPISLWEEDYSQLKIFLDDLRAQGVSDLRVYLRDHPGTVQECMNLIRVLDVNGKTLELFGAGSKEELLAHLDKVFRDQTGIHFTDELVDMWKGKLAYEREGINYTLNDDPIDIQLWWRVLPGYEQTFGRVLVSISDITARKQAEKYLKYLGTHDVLTGLYNRAYFSEEFDKVEREGPYPVSILIADLDNLKHVNDTSGHEEGDQLLRRAAEVFKAAFTENQVVARMGGDEFAIILPAIDEIGAQQIIENIHKLIELNNTYYQGPPLRMSLGTAACDRQGTFHDIQRLADDRMYEDKREHHRLAGK